MTIRVSVEHSPASSAQHATPQPAEHYFTAQPSSEQKMYHVEYSVRGKDYTVTASEGVFSAHGLDKGTKVLLDEVPDCQHVLSNTVQPLCVDVGCGWGPITLALADEYPNALVLGVDVNERALQLTHSNAQQRGLNNVLTCSADEANFHLRHSQGTVSADKAHKDASTESGKLSSALQHGDGWIDLIWSNPPIRIGKEALHELLITWLSLLRPVTGEAYWVVQKNLGADSLIAWLNKQGYPSEKVASKKGFRIIRSRRPQT